jgi:hypothetical protein
VKIFGHERTEARRQSRMLSDEEPYNKIKRGCIGSSVLFEWGRLGTFVEMLEWISRKAIAYTIREERIPGAARFSE